MRDLPFDRIPHPVPRPCAAYCRTTAVLRSTLVPVSDPAGDHSESQKFVAPDTAVKEKLAVPFPLASVTTALGFDGLLVPGGQVPGFCSTHTSYVALARPPTTDTVTRTVLSTLAQVTVPRVPPVSRVAPRAQSHVFDGFEVTS